MERAAGMQEHYATRIATRSLPINQLIHRLRYHQTYRTKIAIDEPMNDSDAAWPHAASMETRRRVSRTELPSRDRY
jgi:hypothetical protein